jgi:hypothetical protein
VNASNKMTRPQERRRGLLLLNRCAIVLTPKAPYVAWANSLDTTGVRCDDTVFANDRPAVFLIPALDHFDRARDFIYINFHAFFESWLTSWCTDQSRWPHPRTWQMFQEWFEWHVHSMVLDAADEPLTVYTKA